MSLKHQNFVHIYVTCIYLPLTGLNSVECYDPSIDEWRTISNMSSRRSSVGVGVVKGETQSSDSRDIFTRNALSLF